MVGLCISKETDLLIPKGMGVAGEALWSPQEKPRHLGVLRSHEAARPHSGCGNWAKGPSGRWSVAGSLSPRGLATGKFLASHSYKSLTFPLSSLSPFNCTHCYPSLCQSCGLGEKPVASFSPWTFPWAREGAGVLTWPCTIVSRLSDKQCRCRRNTIILQGLL